MKYSLLIATLNRPELLKSCVTELLKQTYNNYEIIIVDQSDDDFIDNTIKFLSSKIKYIKIKKKGLSHARNIGLKYATGDYVCLIDDDGIYDRNYLCTADKIIQKLHPCILAGKIQDPYSNVSFSNLNDKQIFWSDIFCSPSPSIIIENSFISQVMFDERFGVGAKYGSGEETDIICSALSQKYKVYFTKSYTVLHPVYSISDVPLNKISKYAFGYGALCKKIISKYSLFWGSYYYIKSVIGNLLFGYIFSPFIDKKISSARRARAKYIIKGFVDYN